MAIFLNSPSMYVVHYFELMRDQAREPRPSLWTLYAGSQPVRVRRLDERSLELQVDAGWFTNLLEQTRDLERSPFVAGETIQLPTLSARVLAVNEDGAPTRVRFTLAEPFDRDRYTFYCWRGRVPAPCQLPARGEVLQLPRLSPI